MADVETLLLTSETYKIECLNGKPVNELCFSAQDIFIVGYKARGVNCEIHILGITRNFSS